MSAAAAPAAVRAMPTTTRATGEAFVPCESGSRESDAALELAEALARRRGGTVLRPRDVVDDPPERVVVIDGCSSGCTARLLEAHGVPVAAAVTLDELRVPAVEREGGVAAAAVDAAERLLDRGARPSRPRRPASPAPLPDGEQRAHTLGDYLFAIDWLTSPVGPCGGLVTAPTLAAHVSVALGVSRPAAGEMLRRLEERGLVHRGEGKELVLTAEGERGADVEVRKHRLLERFVVDVLGYGVAEGFTVARGLGPGFDDVAVDRLETALGRPERCPHGWPVDPVAARDEAHGLVALATLDTGASAAVARVPEHEQQLLERMLAAGVLPGARLEVGSSDDIAVDVSIGGARVRVARADAEHVLVSLPGGR
jgi:DtxR family Mn-dependent transcriptional regulator